MEVCKHNEFCGGCIYQAIDYGEQVTLKGRQIIGLMKEKKIQAQSFLGIEGSPEIYRYRNKMEYTFGDQAKGGPMTLGMHQKGKFMSIVTVEECQLVDEDFNEILKTVLEYFDSRNLPFYHKKSHQGLQRNLIIRKGVRTKEILVNVVTTSQMDFNGSEFADEVLKLQPHLNNEIVGILHTVNDGVADAVICDQLNVLYGRDYYHEEILGLKFKVSAFSFFQTNVEAVERLYLEALSMIDDVEGKTVFDLYCGTGTIAQALARRAKKVVGVEIVEDAVEAARENAELNGLTNCEFIAGDVLKVLDTVTELPDVIVVDPPRMGIHQKALPKIVGYGVPQILYISCNPKTMAENVQYMQLNGYQVKKMKGFDNFPFTKHIECIALLSRVDK